MTRASCGCDEDTAGVIHHSSGCSQSAVLFAGEQGIGGSPAAHGTTEIFNPPRLDPWTMGTLHSLVMHEYMIASLGGSNLGHSNYKPVSTEGLVRKILARFPGMSFPTNLEAELIERVDDELKLGLRIKLD